MWLDRVPARITSAGLWWAKSTERMSPCHGNREGALVLLVWCLRCWRRWGERRGGGGVRKESLLSWSWMMPLSVPAMQVSREPRGAGCSAWMVLAVLGLRILSSSM